MDPLSLLQNVKRHGGHGGHDSSSAPSSSSAESSSGMSSTFFAATNSALYGTAWTPRSTGAYAGTCIFLILLAALFRALFAGKQMAERRWLDSALDRRYVVVAPGAAARPSEAKRARDDADASTALLVSARGVEEEVRVVKRRTRGPVPWRLSVDLPRALLVTVIAGVGYLLMLAVMTFNIGYFLSVLAGTFLGELAVGRYDAVGEQH
ncbi:MAG: hypothetical protein M1832_002485 [Thelocarpon impressellum]|nr:MAG: hypothetical protein M1832_002485 [Thelocarpon impressellum]